MNTPNDTEATAREVPDSAELADLVDEIEQRIANGQAVDIDDYAKRFPNIADPLRAAHASLVSIRHMFADIDAQTALDVGGETGRLGDFRLVGELGRGGMGVVFESEQISLGRQVAIKVLPFAALLDQRQLERFKNEARAAAMLKHPNIVSVYSVGCERGIHFYAMELVHGQSLAELIASWNRESERPLGPHNVDNSHSEWSCDDKSRSAESSFDRAASADTRPIAALSTRNTNNRKSFYRGVASLGVRVAEALDYAHQMGVIHRDIKPSNLLLDQDGHVQITDFGLARIQASDALTMTGDVLGTLRYMSPEQLERGIVVDQRTDVYSLGLTLFELIAGEPAFRGVGRHELTAQILEATPRFPSRIRPHLPRDLETIIGKATDKDPSCRYATAADMAADLQRFLNQKPITARRTGWVERTRRWAGRNRALALSLATVSFLLVLLAAGSTSIAWKLSTEAERNQFAMYARDMRLAQTALGNGDRLAVEKTLLAWVPDEGRDDLRDFEWYYLWNRCHHPAIERTISHQLYAYAVEFVSDDSGNLAVGWFNDHVNIWDWRDTTNSSPIQSFPNEVMGVHQLLHISKKDWLVCGDSDGRITVWDLKTRQRMGPTIIPDIPTGMANQVCSLSVHPNGNLLAIALGGSGSGCVRVWDIPGRKWVSALNDYPSRCHTVFVGARQLAVISDRHSKLEIWNVTNWQREAEYDLTCDGATAVTFSPHRREIAVATYINSGTRTHSSVSTWNVDTWQPVQNLTLHTGRLECVEFSRDGKHLATSGADRSITLVDLDSGRILVVEAAHAGIIPSVAFAPNGKYLASAGRDNQVHIWNVSKLLNEPSASDIRPQNNSVHGQVSSVFADGGTVVATSRYDGEVSLWDARDGRTIREFHVDWPEWLIQLAISREKSLIAVTCGHFPSQPVPAKVEVWSLEEKRVLSTYELPHGVLYSMSSFSPDGQYLAVCCKSHVAVIDVVQQEIRCHLDFEATIKDVDFSPDGKWLACADMGAGTVHLVDTNDFVEKRKPIRADSRACSCVSFSPDSRLVAAGGLDRRVKLFDVVTGANVAEFDECPSYIVKIGFSPKGKRIVSASADGQVYIWNTHTGDRLLTFDFSRVGYPKPEFSADGQSLLVGDHREIKVLRATDTEKLSRLSVVELNDIACQNTIEH